MHLDRLGLVGNGRFAALVDRRATVVWCCLPRFDAEPVFGSLLDPDGGEFAVAPADGSEGTQTYVENTNILETRFDTADGAFRVLDFAPRFNQHQRPFYPAQLVRIVEPLSGTPTIRARCAPILGWSRTPAELAAGSNHVEYRGYTNGTLRLTTDVPISILDGSPLRLTAPHHFMLSWDAPVEEALAPLARRFLDETRKYWQRWVKECNLPPMYQQAVIRSALTLKLHCYEDTGAIVAAVTTSLPESAASGRTWDYRYCWLRDAYYVLEAFRRLGHFGERERFIEFLLNVTATGPLSDLAPLYQVDGKRLGEERVLPHWSGFRGEQPVRVGNAASAQVQHDIFGELVLALAPIFVDDRFAPERGPGVFSLIETLARHALAVAGTPDAGIWEHRGDHEARTFSSLMCWAGADRMALLARRHRPELESEFREGAWRLREDILARAWNDTSGVLTATYDGHDVDAALLQAVTLRFFAPGDPRAERSVLATRDALSRGGLLQRYQRDDGFGVPTSAFLVCSSWLAEALARVGRVREAREALERVLGVASPLGLLAEDCDTATSELWGNFPQALSHVGLIHAAFAASPTWDEVL